MVMWFLKVQKNLVKNQNTTCSLHHFLSWVILGLSDCVSDRTERTDIPIHPEDLYFLNIVIVISCDTGASRRI